MKSIGLAALAGSAAAVPSIRNSHARAVVAGPEYAVSLDTISEMPPAPKMILPEADKDLSPYKLWQKYAKEFEAAKAKSGPPATDIEKLVAGALWREGESAYMDAAGALATDFKTLEAMLQEGFEISSKTEGFVCKDVKVGSFLMAARSQLVGLDHVEKVVTPLVSKVFSSLCSHVHSFSAVPAAVVAPSPSPAPADGKPLLVKPKPWAPLTWDARTRPLSIYKLYEDSDTDHPLAAPLAALEDELTTGKWAAKQKDAAKGAKDQEHSAAAMQTHERVQEWMQGLATHICAMTDNSFCTASAKDTGVAWLESVEAIFDYLAAGRYDFKVTAAGKEQAGEAYAAELFKACHGRLAEAQARKTVYEKAAAARAKK